MTIYQDLKDKIDQYLGTGSIIILFLCALLFWILVREKSRQMKLYVMYVIVSLVMMLNPIALYVIDKSGNMDVYERFFWLLLSPCLVCVTFSFLSSQFRRFVPIVLTIVLLLCGSSVFTSTEYKKAENLEKINAQAIAVSDMIMRDFEGLDETAKIVPNRRLALENCPKVFATEPISEDIRMYNANILLYYVRKNFGSYTRKSINRYASLVTLETKEVKASKILKEMEKRKFTYLVLGDWQTLTGKYGHKNLKVIGQTDNYTVYKYSPKYYTVTHYADINDYQCMCYTIESSDGELIIVDGGRAWQSVMLTDLIKEKGGHVNAWIITHPHDDHCGVLASVLEAAWDQNGQITIDQIYVGKMDYEAVKNDKRGDSYAYLLRGLKTRDNVTWLSAGDEEDICGLKMKVLHTCNDTVLQNSSNIMNDGGMVFKLSARKKSMLFLGDVGDNNAQIASEKEDMEMGSKMGRLIADEILRDYPDDVKSSFVQMSHHGNGSLPRYFYEAVSARYAFFDAPEWLLNNQKKDTGEESYYSTPYYYKMMRELRASRITFHSKKQSVTLR